MFANAATYMHCSLPLCLYVSSSRLSPCSYMCPSPCPFRLHLGVSILFSVTLRFCTFSLLHRRLSYFALTVSSLVSGFLRRTSFYIYDLLPGAHGSLRFPLTSCSCSFLHVTWIHSVSSYIPKIFALFLCPGNQCSNELISYRLARTIPESVVHGTCINPCTSSIIIHGWRNGGMYGHLSIHAIMYCAPIHISPIHPTHM